MHPEDPINDRFACYKKRYFDKKDSASKTVKSVVHKLFEYIECAEKFCIAGNITTTIQN